MLASCLLAFLFPFHLFLFSFAVLGPLHYFTEIPWLHKKKYFTGAKYDYLLLLLLACLIGVFHYVALSIQGDRSAINQIIGGLSYAVFAAALLVATVKKPVIRIVGLVLIAASSVLFAEFDAVTIFFASFVPTIVHVYLFTGAFILYGALKHKSSSGIASLVVYAFCTVLIFTIAPSPTADRSLSMYVKQSYNLFAGLNFELMNLFGLQRTTPESPGLATILFQSNAGIIVMRLIAFSYTYHFLNWFSKTSIIKWHLIPKRSLVIVLILWIASLGLYWYSFEIGLQYLYFISLIHVVLEFPLDHHTFIGIGQELKALVTGKKAEVATQSA